MSDPIVGIATAAGEGGIAIVRLSGDGAADLFQQVFRPAGKRRPPYESHRLMYGHAVDGDEILDECMGVDVNLRWFFCRGSAPTPRTARWGVEGHAAWLRSYRRSDVDSCCLHSKDRHSATGLMARNKGQRGYDLTLAF